MLFGICVMLYVYLVHDETAQPLPVDPCDKRLCMSASLTRTHVLPSVATRNPLRQLPISHFPCLHCTLPTPSMALQSRAPVVRSSACPGSRQPPHISKSFIVSTHSIPPFNTLHQCRRGTLILQESACNCEGERLDGVLAMTAAIGDC